MNLCLYTLPQILIIVLVRAENCPPGCHCEVASLSNLPINSVINNQVGAPTEEHVFSYQNRNEVLDEVDERVSDESQQEEKLLSVTCVLNPTNNLPLFLSLPFEMQVLTILQGPGTANLTLDNSYFKNMENLQVLEIHGFQHGHGILRLQSDALKNLQLLKYLNLQHVHLLGDRWVVDKRNSPAHASEVHFIGERRIDNRNTSVSEDTLRENSFQSRYDSYIIPEAIQLIQTEESEEEIIPYNVYKDEQEQAGLSIFTHLKNLVFLRVYHCNIKELKGKMFDGLQKLRYLSLEGNKIPFLQEFSFYGTPNLKHLTLSHNKLLDMQSIGLAGLLNLEILDLSHNNITHLTEFSLPPLPKLIIADLHNNPIELILPNTFHIMNNTEQLFIGGKTAHLEIRPNSFLGLDKVHKMSLNNAYLTILEKDHLSGMPKLKELKMEGVISKLSYDAFLDVPKLQELILRHCSIKEISMDTFLGLFDLVFLDLSHNELESLPPSLLDQHGSLKEISLHHNKLTTLPQDLFLHTQAKLIRLDKNPWHCSCDMSEWQPSQINKIKVKVRDDSLCQYRYDKGSMCKIHYKTQYRYEQSVGPRCATPVRFAGWSVFHMLRKHLRCDSYIHRLRKHSPKRKTQMNGQHKSMNSTHKHTQIGIIKNTSINTTAITDTFQSTTPTYKTTDVIDEHSTEQTENNDLSPLNNIEINQNMWTIKDKQKFRLLQEKEERISRKLNLTVVADEEENIVINPNIKNKKISPTRKKWQTKMENTMRHSKQLSN